MKQFRIILRGLKSLRSLRTFNDLKIFYQKMLQVIYNRAENFPPNTEVPPILQIEPTDYCNLKCISCSGPRSSRKKGYMDFNLFKKIIDDGSHIGVKRIDLYLHGEPLLHPQLVDMVRYIKSRKLQVEIVTNGMPFKKGIIESLLQSGVDRNDFVKFSIFGHSKEVHERIQIGVNHDRVLRNAFDFIELRKKHGKKGPTIAALFYPMAENEHEEKKFVKYWNTKVDLVKVPRIVESFRDYKRQRNSTEPRKEVCWDLMNRMTVFWNGDVSICCIDVDGDYILGNLKEQSIKEIWKSKQLLALKKLHEEKEFQKFPLCSTCDIGQT